jgi:putative membrane protein
MGSETGAERGPTRRLHPLSWLFRVGATARQLVIPALLLLFASQGFGFELWALLFLIPATAVALVQIVIFRYWLAPGELVIRDGLLTRKERHIPYGRIQNVDLVQNPFHRALGVAEVRLETGSGGKAEAVIRVLSLEAVEELRRRVMEAGARPGEGEDAGSPRALAHGPVIYAMATPDVLRYGLINNRGMVVVGALVGLAWQLDLFDRFWSRLEGFKDLPSWLGKDHWLTAAAAALAALVAFVALLRVLSLGHALLAFHRFTLSRSGEDLRIESGLFTRVTATIPRHRIQLLSIQSGVLARWFGRVSVQVETAGGGGDEDGGDGQTKARTRWLAPLLPEEDLPRLLAQVLPEIDLATLDWQPLHLSARRRLLRRGFRWTALVALAAAFYLRWWALGVLAVGSALAVVHARRYVQHTGWALGEEAVAFQSGWWSRKRSLVRLGKIQTVRFSCSPFDRHHGTARVAVDTAGAGRTGHRVHIPFLGRETATRLRDHLYAAAAEIAFRW